MISTDSTYTGAANVTPPAVGLCRVDQLTLMSGHAAPWTGSGPSTAGPIAPVRLRGLSAAAGATAHPSVPTSDRQELAVIGVSAKHTSSTPGDLPPEDPLS